MQKEEVDAETEMTVHAEEASKREDSAMKSTAEEEEASLTMIEEGEEEATEAEIEIRKKIVFLKIQPRPKKDLMKSC